MGLCGGELAPERTVIANNPAANELYGRNRISNTKYTWYNFILKNLMEQFSRPMNLYFLFIACLQLIRTITPVDPLTTWLPLAVIFSITAVKEGVDDYGRWRADREANSRPLIVVREGTEQRVSSQEVMVGDIIKITEDEEIPCDCVLLTSSDETGNCFIQTTNLDGESNLKGRTSLAETKNLRTPALCQAWKGSVVCAQPDDNLEKFDSQLFSTPNRDEANAKPLTINNLLLQATHLRNTHWVYALAVYVGNETKFGKNKKIPPPKFTRTDDAINEFSVYIFAFQLLLVVILGVVGNVNKDANWDSQTYLRYESPSTEGFVQKLVIPARFLLLNSTMIPISLKVTLDLCKLYYAKFIDNDVRLYDPKHNGKAHSNSTALSEDLGQIEYVLTDKTGTLTQNVMVLKMCSILGRHNYGDVTLGAAAANAPSSLTGDADSVGLQDPALHDEIAANLERHRTDACALELFRCLAVNNDVRPELPDHPSGPHERLYKASSPDEEAFVKACAHYGIILISREGGTQEQQVRVLERPGPGPGARPVVFEQLVSFPFTSDRKRMSVLVRLPGSGHLRLYVKGADDKLLATVAEERMLSRVGNECLGDVQASVNRWATAGYRTLVMAYRDIDAATYAAWRASFDAAARQLRGRDEAMERTYAELERELTLIGATAIEDKLQDRVPETIANLRNANVRFWMCTGDKQSTAETIAKTCRLLPSDANGRTIPPIPIEGETPEQVKACLKNIIARLEAQGYELRGFDQVRSNRIPRMFGAAMPGSRGIGAPAADASEAALSLKEAKESAYSFSSTSSSTSYGTSRVGGSAASAADSVAVELATRGGAATATAAAGAKSAPAATAAGKAGAASPSGRRMEPYTIIAKGHPTIRIALESCRDDFAKVCLSAKSVVCCRVTPKQKAELVRLVKDAGHLALAIGDGGNDVSMIQEAQVGVGIRGKEGLQASRASDYSVANFKSLERLLLVHGRFSYYRTSLVAQYSFYKSFVFCFMQIFYAFLSDFSGVSLFNSLCVAAYNAVLFVPIVFFFVDKDVEQETALRFPESYRSCNSNSWLNYKTFLGWFARAIYHAVIMTVILNLSTPNTVMEVYESVGLVMFGGYMLVQDFTMLFELRRWSWFNLCSIFGMHAFAFLVGLAANNIAAMVKFIDTYSFTIVFFSPLLWLTNLLMLVATVLPVEAWKAFRFARSSEGDDVLKQYDQATSDTAPLCCESARPMNRRASDADFPLLSPDQRARSGSSMGGDLDASPTRAIASPLMGSVSSGLEPSMIKSNPLHSKGGANGHAVPPVVLPPPTSAAPLLPPPPVPAAGALPPSVAARAR